MKLLSSGSTMQRDPWVVLHNGYYYYCCVNAGKEVFVAKTKELADLSKAEFVKVYTAPEEGMWSKELWAPELHIIDGKCYIYIACDDGNNDNHRMYVLENFSDDPQKEYVMHGKITDATDKWAIDGSVIHYNGKMYFVWSGWETDLNVMQHIYIAEMSDPYTICSDRVSITHPEYKWEKRGSTGNPPNEVTKDMPHVNEGPVGLVHDGRLFVMFSASGCWTNDYCVGYTMLKEGGDPLKAEDWEKCKKPLLKKSFKIKGPGHCSFTKIGDDDYIVYHAFDKDAKCGERSVNVRCQKVFWKNGKPYVGKPE